MVGGLALSGWGVTHNPTRWLGFLLMNIGEVGNFISYAFAPASVVAPLGTVRVSALAFRKVL